MIERARRHAARPWAALALACTLVLMQAVGLAHAVLHPPKAPHVGHAGHPAQAHGSGHDHSHHHGDDLEFAGHGLEDESTCRLFDQLSHGEGARAAPAASLPCPAPSVQPGWVAHLRATGPAPRRFLARAPPLAA